MKVVSCVLFALLALLLLQPQVSNAAPAAQQNSGQLFLPSVQVEPSADQMAALAAKTSKTQGIHISQLGSPTWKPVDFHLFSAPVGPGFSEAIATLQSLLPPPNHELHPQLTIGPGDPHQPPYDTELAAGVASQGFREAVHFTQAEFTGENGIFAAWMNVPAPGTIGSSPDFASGPIIDNDLFPIHVSSVSIHNGKEFGPFEADVIALDGVDGHSHFPQFAIDSFEFYPGTKINGSYRQVLDMIDRTGNGWRIEIHVTVTP